METPRPRSQDGKSKRALVKMNEDGEDVAATAAREDFDDVEVWDTLSNGFKRAQLVLDQNRDLIQRVNDNHLSRIPGNVARNVGLIKEINGNLSRVMEIYSGLAVGFATKFDERRRTTKNGDNAATITTGSYGCERSSCGS